MTSVEFQSLLISGTNTTMLAIFRIFFILLSVSLSNGIKHSQIGGGIRANQSVETAPKFIDLNNDVLYIILYKLELQELLQIAKTIPQISGIIREVFRRKYSTNKLSINFDQHFCKNGPEVECVNNTITVHDLNSLVNMFKHFGNFFQNVLIHHDPTTDSSIMEMINRSMNQHCSESLKSLQLKFGNKIADFEGFTTPFKRVEEFSAHIKAHKLNAFKPLNEIFPYLRKLNLTLERDVNVSFIEGHFPHLRYFKLSVGENFNLGERMRLIEQLKGMIMKNPEIQSVELNLRYPKCFIQFLSEALPNLEYLKIYNLQICNSDTLRFENVKHFVLSILHPDDIKHLNKLSLPNLQSLEMSKLSSYFGKWIQFFKRHSHVRQLYVNGSLTIYQMNELVANLPNLFHFSIENQFYYGLESIVWIIQNYEQFEKVEFICQENTIPMDDVITLQEEFQRNWTVEAVECAMSGGSRAGLVFKRKQLIQECPINIEEPLFEV